MKKGFVQVYTGDGKGKTTAAIGLAVRCAGSGNRVFIVQFMKAMKTGELLTLEKIENIEIFRVCETTKFSFEWTERERNQERDNARSCIDRIKEKLKTGIDLLILDEALGAISAEVLTEDDVLGIMESRPEETEIVITGRGLPKRIAEKADLITEMLPIKHYMEKGVNARKGIEF